MKKPLPPHKTKALLDTFLRNAKELEIYEAALLAPTQLKELLKSDRAWVVTEKSKWE